MLIDSLKFYLVIMNRFPSISIKYLVYDFSKVQEKDEFYHTLDGGLFNMCMFNRDRCVCELEIIEWDDIF